MTGATLVTDATDRSDDHNFERWIHYARSGDPTKAEHAVNELLLRLERVRFEPSRLAPEPALRKSGPFDQQSSRNLGRIATSSLKISCTTSIAWTSPRPPTFIRNTP